MSAAPLRVKVLVPHKRGCIAVRDDEQPLGLFLEEAVYLTTTGRKGWGERWLVARCNSECPGRVAVAERDILAEVHRALEAQKK